MNIVKVPITEEDYALNPRNATQVRCVPCPGDCMLHIELLDEDNFVIAIAPCDRGLLEFIRNQINEALAAT